VTWKDILKSEEIKGYERMLDKAKEKANSRKYTPDTRESIDAILNSLDAKLARLKKLDRLDGSEVMFEDTMDRLDYFINLHYR
tara:strand:- start:2976 stop:3224 length:249 start_codon:yes stop_codon:yes gene_type:complete